jgi:hypothetical protein
MKKVIEFEIEESLLREVDEVTAQIGVSREVYIVVAIKHALRVHRPKELGEQDEMNAFRLWMIDDDDDNWLDGSDWGNPWDEPGGISPN